MEPPTCQSLIPGTNPSASSLASRSRRESGVFACDRNTPWSMEPSCSLSATWSSAVSSPWPRNTSRRCSD
eukprot:2933836-Pyramimonas_sp.AAC.1